MSGKREGLVNAAPYGSPVTKHQSCRKYEMFSFSASLIFTGIVKTLTNQTNLLQAHRSNRKRRVICLLIFKCEADRERTVTDD